jgi:hypothetical protein
MALLPAYAFSLADYGSAKNPSVDRIEVIWHVDLSIPMTLACLMSHQLKS